MSAQGSGGKQVAACDTQASLTALWAGPWGANDRTEHGTGPNDEVFQHPVQKTVVITSAFRAMLCGRSFPNVFSVSMAAFCGIKSIFKGGN